MWIQDLNVDSRTAYFVSELKDMGIFAKFLGILASLRCYYWAGINTLMQKRSSL
jgi:hypothetical protein